MIKNHNVRSHIWVFINCLINNPEFSSQTKDSLTSTVSSFGSKCIIQDDYVKKIKKLGVLDKLLEMAELKGQQQLKKGDGKKKSRLTGAVKHVLITFLLCVNRMVVVTINY